MKKFKKGELVVILDDHDFPIAHMIPKVGKIALSERDKNKHLRRFGVFYTHLSLDEYTVLELPDAVVKKLGLLDLIELRELMDKYSDTELRDSFYVCNKRLILPTPKSILVSDVFIHRRQGVNTPNYITEHLSRQWAYIKKHGCAIPGTIYSNQSYKPN